MMNRTHMILNGDSMGGNRKTPVTISASKSTVTTYKNLRIGIPIGTPSVQPKKIVAAVRAAMQNIKTK